MKKDLTCISDLTKTDIDDILGRAFGFKRRAEEGVRFELRLQGKVVAMIFEKPSLRTKVAFEVAAASLGATPVFLSSEQILASGSNQRGRESVPDIARNLERFADLIIARVYSHDTIDQIAQSIKKPVINALCDQHHPTQALADLMGIMWHKQTCRGRKVAFIGDGNNVATSLLQICAMMGTHFSIATPHGYEIPPLQWKVAEKYAKESGAKIEPCKDPRDAMENADVVYTDTFVSMGQELEQKERLDRFYGYQINTSLMQKAKRDAVFMHCLPAHRGEEVTDEVFDSSQSIVFDQAECRLHIAKALLSKMLEV